jgi:hypothetical protein
MLPQFQENSMTKIFGYMTHMPIELNAESRGELGTQSIQRSSPHNRTSLLESQRPLLSAPSKL